MNLDDIYYRNNKLFGLSYEKTEEGIIIDGRYEVETSGDLLHDIIHSKAGYDKGIMFNISNYLMTILSTVIDTRKYRISKPLTVKGVLILTDEFGSQNVNSDEIIKKII